MSCLVNTVHGSHVPDMAAETVPVLCQLKQGKESASSRTQKRGGPGEICQGALKMR